MVLRVGNAKEGICAFIPHFVAGRRNQNGSVTTGASLALAEIMVLRGDRNLAAGRHVTAPTSREAPLRSDSSRISPTTKHPRAPVGAAMVMARMAGIAYPNAAPQCVTSIWAGHCNRRWRNRYALGRVSTLGGVWVSAMRFKVECP